MLLHKPWAARPNGYIVDSESRVLGHMEWPEQAVDVVEAVNAAPSGPSGKVAELLRDLVDAYENNRGTREASRVLYEAAREQYRKNGKH